MFNRFTHEARRAAARRRGRRPRARATRPSRPSTCCSRSRAATTPVARVLRDAGLDYDGIASALVGRDRAQPRRGRRQRRQPDASARSWRRRGSRTSAKWALELLAAGRARARRPPDRHRPRRARVLRAAHGTVPRALAIAGVDREELGARGSRL